ncbi:hypothetical protein KL86PLE_40047 [uncultured Pleomorphomonas sp.]|uniref:Uncharacterized protein n=1 Tax=uncultured Pleomorphomonas sp. TaxID=442121 RepID=A0A212LFA3_9HYPH|nr:hypothetical protein KL86PLE_40047 [uncultured Pleomorphomonas sp.]
MLPNRLVWQQYCFCQKNKSACGEGSDGKRRVTIATPRVHQHAGSGRRRPAAPPPAGLDPQRLSRFRKSETVTLASARIYVPVASDR